MASSTKAATRRRTRRVLVAAVAVVVLIGVVVVVRDHPAVHLTASPPCRATAGKSSYALDGDQAANATTIAAVGKRMGLPDHAVTIALAAALQESRLHNLPGGDRDSLGLFQQRPSQGWGTPEQIMVPRLAAAAFYRGLAQVPDWENRTVTDAAQAVQHSAAGSAYAQWESEARVIARVLTGEVPAGLSCRFSSSSDTPSTAALTEAMDAELGSPALGQVVAPERGWLVSSWLVGHSQQFDVGSVSFAGQRWTARAGRWQSNPPARAVVAI